MRRRQPDFSPDRGFTFPRRGDCSRWNGSQLGGAVHLGVRGAYAIAASIEAAAYARSGLRESGAGAIELLLRDVAFEMFATHRLGQVASRPSTLRVETGHLQAQGP